MVACGICKKEMRVITYTHLKLHNITKEEYKNAFPQATFSWNSGNTKKTDSRIAAINCRIPHPKAIGHKPTFSRDVLGDKYDEINEKRALKISQNANIEACKRGAEASHNSRIKNGTYTWSEDAAGRNSEKYKGRKPWNKGKTKETDIRLKKKNKKYPEDIDFTLFGWTLEKAQEIRKRDYFTCQKCGKTRVSIVHHRDGDRRHNTNDNLITLCRGCHQEVHMERDPKGRFKFRKVPLEILATV